MSRAREKSVRRLRDAIRQPKTRSRPRCTVVAGDSRIVLGSLPAESVDCVITSPPYGNLKNYGHRSQLGFGQHPRDEYLPDLGEILRELYRLLKRGGSTWIVLDTWRSSGETMPLPMQVVTLATALGFRFCDMVVWDKGKSLPWSHHGRFRGVCEYILLFSKGRLRTFNLQAARESNDLASYWVKYPERYHPDGKAPSDLWHFPIPVQGSWGKSRQSRHFCPFPLPLVARIVELSTTPGAVVLDPFAGTSSVPTVASLLGRNGFGIELNSAFVDEFHKSGYERIRAEIKSTVRILGKRRSSLRQTIVDLRILKFSRVLYSAISRGDRLNGAAREAIGAFLLNDIKKNIAKSKKLDTESLAVVQVTVLLREGAVMGALRKAIDEVITINPLSKFGLDITIDIVPHRRWNGAEFFDDLSRGRWYLYRRGQFYKYDAVLHWKQLRQALVAEARDTRQKVPAILSQLDVSLEIPVSDQTVRTS
jgi:DNA modification methylase